MQQSRNQELDGLRGLAALCVALGHCVTNTTGYDVWTKSITDFPNMNLVQIIGRLGYVLFPADAAVIIFFVLSGYVLWGSLLRREAHLLNVIPYMTGRFYRLLPVAVISVLLLAFVMPATGQDVARNALLLSSNMNSVQWSLQVELIASLFLFVVFFVIRQQLLFIALGITFLIIYLTNLYQVHFPLFFIPFLLGITLHYLSSKVFQSTFLFTFAYLALITADLLLQRGPLAHYVCFFAAWVIVGGVIHQKFSFLRASLPQFLGKISYSFYLSHLTATLLSKKLIGIWGINEHHLLIIFFALVVFSLGIAIPLSWLVHVFVEKPGIAAGSGVVNSMSQWVQNRLVQKQIVPELS